MGQPGPSALDPRFWLKEEPETAVAGIQARRTAQSTPRGTIKFTLSPQIASPNPNDHASRHRRVKRDQEKETMKTPIIRRRLYSYL